MTLIGRGCKCGNALSWPILICRGLDLQMQAQMLSNHSFDSSLCSVFRVQALRNAEDTIAKRSEKLVLIVLRVHLFPSRTQKLSSGSSTIVCGWLHVKIDNANILDAPAVRLGRFLLCWRSCYIFDIWTLSKTMDSCTCFRPKYFLSVFNVLNHRYITLLCFD